MVSVAPGGPCVWLLRAVPPRSSEPGASWAGRRRGLVERLCEGDAQGVGVSDVAWKYLDHIVDNALGCLFLMLVVYLAYTRLR